MTKRWKNLAPPLACAALLVLLGAMPIPAQEPVEPAAEPGVKVEKDVKVHRVVLAPTDEEGLRVVRVPVDGEEGVENKRVKLMVRTGEDGEVKTFDWTGDVMDAEHLEHAVKLGQNARAIFVPGVPRGFLGVQLTDLTSELRTHFGAGDDRGVLVARVVPDSPAARAGLQVGDVLTHVDGQAVDSSFDVTTRIANRKDGEVVGLEVIRDGRVETLNATLEVRERPQLEVGEILRQLEKSGEAFEFEFDTEAFEQEMEKVREYFDSEEWQREMEKMKVEIRRELEDMEVEMEQLERTLEQQNQELEQLDEEGEPRR